MSRISRRGAAVAASSMLALGALVAPSVAPAKTVKFKVTAKFKVTGTKSVGTASGTFGKGTLTGKVTPPVIVTKVKYKGGTITYTTPNSSLKGSAFQGSVKLKGTGKYKKLKGKGKFTGSLTTLTVIWTGTATY